VCHEIEITSEIGDGERELGRVCPLGIKDKWIVLDNWIAYICKAYSTGFRFIEIYIFK
jgi:hypothetical protein